MSAGQTPRKTFRIPAEIVRMIQEISEHQHGLTDTAVIINGVKAYHREIFGAAKKGAKKTSKKSPPLS